MPDTKIILPSKPRIISEDDFRGTYEIDGLYPGYGHTLGNSLRRIIYSSLPGAAVTSVKINDVPHEFSTIAGVKEDVIAILLNLKKVRFQVLTDEPQTASIKQKGLKLVTAGDIVVPGQVKVLNPEQYIANVTDKSVTLQIDMMIEKGLGYVPKETIQKERVEIGTIALDAAFTPVKRANYEVENMRVGDRTDFNKLRIFIETDGTVTPREVLEKSIEIMINQLKSIIGFEEEKTEASLEELHEVVEENTETGDKEMEKEFLKTRIESLNLSARTENALNKANIRTVGGLARKKTSDLLALTGLGEKGVQEIKRALGNFGIVLD
ncbi:DNA-directed RNA polymerase subunit alpha [Candidatus Campbellbacteria bacterium CG11_big_fil_rev_8_21_14_0_20_44_21]|uniref:DNA-directed RNA polymerase subunit alpha n=1 Tax=Candidatus Campbellbacteria bacterium CG22_combo_CG10-13_8_21_14_all_43_18 TaxID=1974530 RepID=A0A2H0DXZ9_9BACT|nr:MAG: DNA-directed RNA polymerase subunit alpha [Candidatus Campbellbacteria bacterium CG22_combo_CG10-13_8_21_14_all_43_18]PIR24440.1 MAG: DNA-directed RNA polymerase subunit alpha [Candidatus Campbellbacteria bacterium CG11_big_fil_rev_8_21_14_0_20_44_21]